MQAPDISEVAKGIAQKFCDSLAQVLSASCHMSWQAGLAENQTGAQPDANGVASFRYIFDGGLSGDTIVAFPKWGLSRLSLRDLSDEERNSEFVQIAKLLTGLQQGVAGLASSLDEEGATSLRIEGIEHLSLQDEYVLEIWIQSDANNPDTRVSLHLCIGQKLLTEVQSQSAKPMLFPDAASTDAANLNLVMDVELNVTLRFGQRQLALREVLELTSGSVVELDRQVDEPVELILDGRVVARGEAVIIDGNYGMRVTQLVHNVLQ
jgi:flagellar motor switch protein FliN/FliY